MKICIVVPVHNEIRAIRGVVEGGRAKGLDVVVVDDGSDDGSGEAAGAQGAIVIRNPSRKGKGYSLRRGFEYAVAHDYEALITMDGDGQHDVADLDQFLKKKDEEPRSIITGTRMQDTRTMPLVRRLTNRFMSRLISILCRQSIPDTQCGFRYIHCDILKKINIVSHDFEIETEVLVKAGKAGYKVFSVPVKTIYRGERSKVDPFKDTLRFMKYLMRELTSGHDKRIG